MSEYRVEETSDAEVQERPASLPACSARINKESAGGR